MTNYPYIDHHDNDDHYFHQDAKYIEPDYYANDANRNVPIMSTIGRGPEGDGIEAEIIASSPDTIIYRLFNNVTGETVFQSPNLSGGTITVSQTDANPEEGEFNHAVFTVSHGGVKKSYDVTIPPGSAGARIYTIEGIVLRTKQDQYQWSVGSLMFDNHKTWPSKPKPRPYDIVMFSCHDDAKAYLAVGVVRAVENNQVVVTVQTYVELITPHIGDNGNWFVGEFDTGVKAQGAAGKEAKMRIGTVKTVGPNIPASAEVTLIDEEDNIYELSLRIPEGRVGGSLDIGNAYIVDDGDAAKKTTNPEIVIASYKSNYTLNNMVHFSDSQTQGSPKEQMEVKRDDGTFLAPPRTFDTNVSNSWDYGMYKLACNWNMKGVIYPASGDRNTIWDSNVVDTDPPILVCSDYLCALLRGVTYEGSAIVNGVGNNAFGQYHCSWDDNLGTVMGTDRLSYTSYELAYWLATKGRLFYKSNYWLNIMPGDLLFTGNPTSNPDSFLNIGHSQLVIACYPECGYAIVTECGNTSANFYWNMNGYGFTAPPHSEIGPQFTVVRLTASTIRAVGRPNYPCMQPIFNVLSHNATVQDNYTGSITSAHPQETISISEQKDFKLMQPVIVRIYGHITNKVTNDKAIDVRVSFRSKKDNKYKDCCRMRWQNSQLNKLVTSGFLELPLCLFEESDLLRVRLSYSGTSTGYDFKYNFTDIQFIELL